ncbi:sigma-70 family RNA polymerase sigma factor [Actinomycetospora sp. OC33-EN08]|uniref:Sigma-70 family RNA polymerase sigma factor n=1 Tax=Actinomycetospora aurantiaca TaxID=3129233 RepID=A0ABU8MM86_9PSEU
MDEAADAAVTRAAERARGGDRVAAGEFVRLTQDQVWRLLVHLADRGIAQDLAQETYERAFGALPRYRGEAPARAWLLSIARRVAADHLRRRTRRPVVAMEITGADEPWGRPLPGDAAEQIVLEAAVTALDPDRREAFVLTQVVGLGYAEAAHVCGCPVGTIRSRVARARADLVRAVHGGTAPGAADAR